jgi:hypothetical protein
MNSSFGKLVTSTNLEAIAQVAGSEPTLGLPERLAGVFGKSARDG